MLEPREFAIHEGPKTIIDVWIARIFVVPDGRGKTGYLISGHLKMLKWGLAEIIISCKCLLPNLKAHVAELVDALDSGSSGGNPVDVRVIS